MAIPSKVCKVALTRRRYSGSLGGRTRVRPVAAATTKIISMDILTLFHPPRSIVNEIYFSSPYESGINIMVSHLK